MSNDLNLEPRRTTWGAIVQTANYVRVPVPFLTGTTINEKFSVFPNESIEDTDYPELNYFGYGRGSTYMKVISDGSNESSNYLHEPLDAVLFNQMPFIMRTLDNDITSAQRANYALRAIVEHNSISYVAYYLKRLDKSSSIITNSVVVPATATELEESNLVVADPRYLSPTPTKADAGTERTDGAYVRVSCIVESKMDAWDIDEMLNAKQILTGSSQLEITEIGLFSGVPKTVSNAVTGSTVTYTEALRAQLNVVSPHRLLLNQYVGRELSINHDFGVDDPTSFNFIF